MISKYLNNIGSFSSGAFSSKNDGSVGSGWGIATPTTFVAVNDKEYYLYPTGGLIIDLYSLFEMYPNVKLSFSMDSGEFVYNKPYFDLKLTNNILNIIPNGIILKNDNFLDKNFILPIYYQEENKETEVINLKIYYKNITKTESGPIEYELEYDNLNISLSFAGLVKEYITGASTGTLDILSINSKPLIDYNLVKEDIVKSQYLDLSKITEFNPKIKLNYKDPTLSINYIFDLSMKYRDLKPPKTFIPDIHVTISPKDAIFIDIKEYAIGDSYKIKLEEVHNKSWIPLSGSDYMDLYISENYITILPYTEDLIDGETGLKETTQFVKNFIYETSETKGIFKLHVNIDMKNALRSIEDYKLLVPTVSSKILKISDKDFAKTPINLLGLVKNSYFPSKDKTNSLGEIRGTLQNPIIPNIGISMVDGIFLFSTDKIEVPSILNVKFDFPFSSSKIIELKLEEDTPLYEEYFKVSPMVFNVSKNNAMTLNLIDYIKTENENYKYLEYIWDSNLGNLFNYPNGFNFEIRRDLFDDKIVESKTSTGEIEVKLSNLYTDENNKDDFGNIIGYRKIPYTIIWSNENDEIDTSLDLDISDIRYFFNDFETFIEGVGIDYRAPNNLDKTKYNNNTIEFLNIKVNSITTKSWEKFIPSTNPLLLGDKVAINFNSLPWILFFNAENWSGNNEKIVLEIEYKNENNEVKEYIQNIYFYKL